MKRLIFGVIGAVLAAGSSASAADLAARPYTKAPAPVVALYNWSGFYIGINGGGGSSRKCWDLTQNVLAPVVPAFPEGCHDATGGTVGGQIGYRWQASSWVFGIEAQGNWANFRGNNQNLFTTAFGFPQVQDQSKIDAFGLFTGQIGYAANNVLFYVKGGAAVVNDKYTNFTTAQFGAIPTGATFASGSETRWGAVVGAGIEYGLTPNWTIAAEYDHMFMGTQSVTLNLIQPFGAGVSGIRNIRQDVDIGTVRLNYKFGGPVVARY